MRVHSREGLVDGLRWPSVRSEGSISPYNNGRSLHLIIVTIIGLTVFLYNTNDNDKNNSDSNSNTNTMK